MIRSVSAIHFKGACYHSQQSIEKAIKAMLFTRGWELERVPSIERLAAIGEDYKISLNISDEEVIFIDTIYRGGYPVEAGLLPLGEPSGNDAGKAVSIARRVFNDIKAAMTGQGLAAEEQAE
ncbi:MAG: HEPN domain-containing protein [bacterium]